MIFCLNYNTGKRPFDYYTSHQRHISELQDFVGMTLKVIEFNVNPKILKTDRKLSA